MTAQRVRSGLTHAMTNSMRGRLAALVQALHLLAPQCKHASARLHSIDLEQSKTHAGPEVSSARLLHRERRSGSRVQSCGRHPAQACSHALDRKRCKPNHCPPLQQTQWTIRGLLGVPLRPNESCRMNPSPKSVARPKRVTILRAASLLAAGRNDGPIPAPLGTQEWET